MRRRRFTPHVSRGVTLLALLVCCQVALAADRPGRDDLPPARGLSLNDRDVDRDKRPEIRTPLAGDLGLLELERFQVFSPDAVIVVHGPEGDVLMRPPANSYYKGHVKGRVGTRVLVTVLEDGTIRGLVEDAGRLWAIGGTAFTKSSDWHLESRLVEPVAELDHEALGFECRSDDLQSVPPDLGVTSVVAPVTKSNTVSYTARIAVETDNEFFSKFGNEVDATNYVADIIAYGSIIYSAELDTSWLLQYLSLWSPGTTDPWGEASPGCGLYEFGRYWNDNRQGVARTTAAFFSGKSANSGIAWVGVLCRGAFNVNLGESCPSLQPSIDNYGGAYAYIGGMDGNFDINNPTVVWDIVAATHEIGHNFSSPHTHCYANVGGNPDSVDHCYASQPGCYSGATSLPAGCPGAGQGCGTIMSYCHLLYPYMSNLSLTFGRDHPYGIEPDRVPDQMLSHVQSQATIYPGCLDFVLQDAIFTNGFEPDDDDWSATVP